MAEPPEKSQHWYLPDPYGNEAHGPFTSEALIEKIHRGELRVDDFVWSEKFGDTRWRCFYEIAEFKSILRRYPVGPVPKKLNRGITVREKQVQLNFTKVSGNFGDQNQYRRYPRAPLSTEVIIHNQKTYRRGVCLDISEKGLFLSCDDLDVFKKGEEVMVILRNPPVIGAVAISSVVLRIAKSGEMTGYGLYFLRLNPQVKRRIAKYVLSALEGHLKERIAA